MGSPPFWRASTLTSESASFVAALAFITEEPTVCVYASNKGYRWRMVHHILHHEQPLLSLMTNNAAALSRSPIGWPPVTFVDATARSSLSADGLQASGT